MLDDISCDFNTTRLKNRSSRSVACECCDTYRCSDDENSFICEYFRTAIFASMDDTTRKKICPLLDASNIRHICSIVTSSRDNDGVEVLKKD